MITITFGDVRNSSNLELKDDGLYDRVAESANTIFQAIEIMERFAKPYAFSFYGATLLRFERISASGMNHNVRCMGETPVDDIATWQIYGRIQKKIVNIVIECIRHGHKESQTGSWEYKINGKYTHLNPEYGGVSLEDCWQSSHKWEAFGKIKVDHANSGTFGTSERK